MEKRYRITNPQGEVREDLTKEDVSNFKASKGGVVPEGYILESYDVVVDEETPVEENPATEVKPTTNEGRQNAYGTAAKLFPYTADAKMSGQEPGFKEGFKDVFSLPGRALTSIFSDNDMGVTSEEANHGKEGSLLQGVTRSPWTAAGALSAPVVAAATAPLGLLSGVMGQAWLGAGLAGMDVGSRQYGYESKNPVAEVLLGGAMSAGGEGLAQGVSGLAAKNLARNIAKNEFIAEPQLDAITNIVLRGIKSEHLNPYELELLRKTDPSLIEKVVENLQPSQRREALYNLGKQLHDFRLSNIDGAGEGTGVVGRTVRQSPNKINRGVSAEERNLAAQLTEANEKLASAKAEANENSLGLLSDLRGKRNKTREAMAVTERDSRDLAKANENLNELTGIEGTMPTEPSQGSYNPNTRGFATYVPPGPQPKVYPFNQYNDGLVAGARRGVDNSEKALAASSQRLAEAQAAEDEARAALETSLESGRASIGQAQESVDDVLGKLASEGKLHRGFNFSRGEGRQLVQKPRYNSPVTETDEISQEFANTLRDNLEKAAVEMNTTWDTIGGRPKRNWKNGRIPPDLERDLELARKYQKTIEDVIHNRARAKGLGISGTKEPRIFNEDIEGVLETMAQSNQYEFAEAVLKSCPWLPKEKGEALLRMIKEQKSYMELNKGYDPKKFQLGKIDGRFEGLSKVPAIGPIADFLKITSKARDVTERDVQVAVATLNKLRNKQPVSQAEIGVLRAVSAAGALGTSTNVENQ